MWDLIVPVPDHCLSFYFILIASITRKVEHIKDLTSSQRLVLRSSPGTILSPCTQTYSHKIEMVH